MAARTYLLWLILAFFSGAVFAQAPAQIKWAPDLATAKQASAQFKVPLMIHFYGDGCTPCRTLEQNVLSKPEVVQVLNKFFICVSVNGSRDSKTMAEYGVHSFPRDVFLSPTGEVLYQEVSQQDPRNYLGTLERVAVMNRDRNAVLASKKETNNSTSSQQAMNTKGTLVSTSSNSSLPGLPPPGYNNPSSADQSGFYNAQGAQSNQQKLPLGAASSSVVQSGPLLGSQQPVSITGSAPQSQHMVGSLVSGAVASHNNVDMGGLPYPPLNNNPIPQLRRDATAQLGAYTQVATTAGEQLAAVPSQALDAFAVKADSATAKWNASLSTATATVDNPHFKPLANAPVPNLTTPVVVASKPSETVTTPSHVAASQIPNAHQPATHSPQNTMTVAVPDVSSAASQLATSVTPNLNRLASTQLPAVQPAQIDGYCPVSLRGKQWKKGDSRYAVKHRGMVFNFADSACQEEFLRNPDHYTPILLGNDPMILLKEGRMVPGSTQNGLFEDRNGALFFASPESKAEFYKNFEKNMQDIEQILRMAATR